MESEIDRNEIPAGQFCQTVIRYNKSSDDGFGGTSPSIHHVYCKHIELGIISGLENAHMHSPFCLMCMFKKEALVEKELTMEKYPIKICGIKDQPIPEDLLSLSLDDVREKSDEELAEINRKLKEHQNAS